MISSMYDETYQPTALRQLPARRFGWEELVDDPWGSCRAYADWIVKDWGPATEKSIFAVTVLTRGSAYLATLACSAIDHSTDFGRLSPRGLLEIIGLGCLVDRRIRSLGVLPRGQDGEVLNYYEPLPSEYVAFMLQ